MASRQLSRLNLPPEVASRLAAAGLATVRDLYTRTLLDLVEQLDLPYDAVQDFLRTAAAAAAPTPTTALELLQRSQTAAPRLPTLLPPIDAALGGGLPAGSITEIVGPAGLGKTNFCLGILAAAVAAPNGGKVLYIDTERKFASERLTTIAKNRFPQVFSTRESLAGVLERTIVKHVKSTADLLSMLSLLEASIIDHGIKFIIIDSIAALARADFGAGDIPARQRALGAQASALKRLAEAFRIPVLVTNQITTVITPLAHPDAGGVGGGDGTGVMAALGPMWAHAVNTRLVMSAEQDPITGGQVRVLTIAKSPSAPNSAAVYTLAVAGIVAVEGATAPPAVPGTVVGALIANYQSFEAGGGPIG